MFGIKNIVRYFYKLANKREKINVGPHEPCIA